MSTSPRRSSTPLPTGRGWWLVAAAIATGVAVFLMMLWLAQRDDRGGHRPDEQPPASAAPAFKPLPTPSTSGLAGRAPDAPLRDSGARIDEPSGLSTQSASAPAAGPGYGEGSRDAARPAVELSASSPVPIESPGPRYPARALRRGESGEVLLRIHVDARGVPSMVEVVSSSGSKDLDRAAQNNARRWRFRPALRDGAPVAGVVNVPITFNSGR